MASSGDPDQMLTKIRQLCDSIGLTNDPEDAEDLAQAFLGLDQHLTAGETLPVAWGKAHRGGSVS